MYTSFWDVVLDPVFLIMFGLVLSPFLALLWSVWSTWQRNGEIEE